ncbi:MAG: hypothetical protein B6D82_03100 [gamma proteobacterium symbiont of Ctena orbiculata]|nr:MAG: hypothetical protein B6D82_03100 [gamma proteobacterium symbiont of Ctena orbiculata]
MLKQLITLSFLLIGAVDETMTEKGDSIMFAPKEHPFTQAPQAEEGEAERCAQLANEIEALKGRPQRRHAALERYRLICSDKGRLE